MKIIGVSVICFAVASYGFLYTLSISFRIKALSEMIEFNLYFKNNIRFKSDDIISLFKDFKPKYNTFLKAYSNNFDLHIKESSLNEAETAAISAFLSELGKSDVIGQTEHCEHYITIFQRLKDDAKSELIEKGRLSKSLSLLASAALFILLI